MQSSLMKNLEQIEKSFRRQMQRDNDIERNWKFTVSHPDMICPKEISDQLSRKNPIAFVRSGTGKDSVLHVIFHFSIVKKARYLSDFPFNVDYLGNEIYMAYNIQKKESDVVKWAKDVRNRSWGQYYKPTKVVVGIPKV